MWRKDGRKKEERKTDRQTRERFLADSVCSSNCICAIGLLLLLLECVVRFPFRFIVCRCCRCKCSTAQTDP